MPDIGHDEVARLIDNRPPNLQPQDILSSLEKKGYTIGGKAIKLGGEVKYPEAPSATSSALEATKEALAKPIPVVGGALEKAKSGISEASQEAQQFYQQVGYPHLAKFAGTGGALLSTAIPSTMGDAALQALAGPIVEGAGAVAGKVSKTVGPVARDVANSLWARTIGVAEPFLENVRRNPAALKELSNDPMVIQRHIINMGQFLKRGLDRIGSKIGEIEDKYLEMATKDIASKAEKDAAFQKAWTPDWNPEKEAAFHADWAASHPQETQKVVISDIHDDFSKTLSDKGVSIPGKEASARVEGIASSDIPTMKKYLSVLKDLNGKASFLDLLNLRRQIGEDVSWNGGVAPKVGTNAERILKGLRSEINKKLYTMAPELQEADSLFSNARKNYDLLHKQYFKGEPEQVYMRVKLAIQRGVSPEALVGRSMQISETASKAMNKLIDRVSAQQFAPYIRRGVAGPAMAVGLWPSLVGHLLTGPQAAIADATMLAASSPRLSAMGIQAAPVASQAVSNIVEAAKNNPMLMRTLLQTTLGSSPKPNLPPMNPNQGQ